ncbi:MAG: sensor histidine kinase [Oscillospiraceae bacterium]|nr:sensor histidine kinase [Oscillospiraceae bacterium]
MKELSLNILDITMNSVKAGADKINISLFETEETLQIEIKDNGCGMKEDFVKNVTDPFTTTRTTRKVGLGIPFFKLAAEQTGGSLNIVSKHESDFPDLHGTVITALFYKNHFDFTPLGDIISTLVTLLQGAPEIEWLFVHKTPAGEVLLDTAELRSVLGDIPLNTPDVLLWIRESLEEQYGEIKAGSSL